MATNNLPPINLDDSSTYQYMVYDPTIRRTAISETTKYAGTGTFLVADGIPYRDAINTLRQPQTYTPVWFGNADYTATSVSSIVLGDRGGGAVTTGVSTVAITPNVGAMDQADYAVAVGYSAGQINQGLQCIAIGSSAGQAGQVLNSIAIGRRAGLTDQADHAIAIGNRAGEINQQSYAIAIGSEEPDVAWAAGIDNQGTMAIAIGSNAGKTNQGMQCIAIGEGAGQEGQFPYSIAIGLEAGHTGKQSYAIAIGKRAGRDNQGKHAISIGNYEGGVAHYPGGVNQGYGAIAIGSGAAGPTSQGAYSICIGFNAGSDINNPVSANSIMIDATGPPPGDKPENFAPSVSGTYIRPIRNIANTDPSLRMHYDPVNFELSWGAEASSARFKTRVINLSDRVTAKTLELNPVEFDLTKTGRHGIGFIAEDVYKILPEIAVRNPLTDAIDGIEYDKLVVPLVRLAQNQQHAIDSLQASLKILQTVYKTLQTNYNTVQTSCGILQQHKTQYLSHLSFIRKLSVV